MSQRIGKSLLSAGAAICIALLAACGGGTSTSASGKDNSAPSPSPQSFATFRESVPKTSDGIYVVEGDIPIRTDAELKEYFDEMNSFALVAGESGTPDAVASPTPSSKLLVSTRREYLSGAWTTTDNVWSVATRQNLSYCVDNGFGSNKQLVVDAMAKAARTWESTANVHFIYKAAEDSNCTNQNSNVFFSVRYVTGQIYLGLAFLPNKDADLVSLRGNRVLNINDKAFNSYTPLPTTVLHEMGHILGFLHEFSDQNMSGSCSGENATTSRRRVTSYDAASIMNYPSCNQNTNINGLTLKDKDGAALVYGFPVIPNSDFASTEVVLRSIKTGYNICAYGIDIDSCSSRDGAPERFKFIQNSDGTVAIMSMVNGKYVTAGTFATAWLHASADTIDTWEKYILISNADGSISLKSMMNDKYVTIPSPQLTGPQLAAGAAAIDTWEKFTVTKKLGAVAINNSFLTQNMVVYVQAVKSGKYWVDQANTIYADRDTVDSWEKFKIKANADGTVSLWSQVNSRYFTIGYFGWIYSTATTAGIWEKFRYVNNSDGSVSFQSVGNNYYLTIPPGYSVLQAGASSINAWEKFRIYPEAVDPNIVY